MADKEALSVLVDGEVIDKTLIQTLAENQESLQAWERYHLIGDVMRGDVSDNLQWNIAENVAMALENEPTYRPVETKTDILNDQYVEMELQPTASQARRQLPTWLTSFGQVAMAACVSLVVILGVQQYSSSDSVGSENNQLPVLQTVPFAGSAAPVSLTRNSVEKQDLSHAQEQQRRVYALLQDYELQLRLNSKAPNTTSDMNQSVSE